MRQSLVETGFRGHVPLRQKVLPDFGDVKPLADTAAWGGVNLMISGLILGGGLGYLADRLLGTSWLVVIGLLSGMALALTVGWFRYGTGRESIDQAGDNAASSAHADIKTTEGQG